MEVESAAVATERQNLVLKAFSRAFRREAHVLTQYPDLLWQQLYNRLQWEGEEVRHAISRDLAKRNVSGAKTWMRLSTPFRESKALVRVLAGHKGMIQGCAFSPDGQWIVSASEDKTLKIWETATGIERTTLIGHTSKVMACVVSSDGQLIVSASDDQTLKIWDATTGKERATLIGHTKGVRACSISSDGELIVSASDDETIKLWDTATGAERATFTGHTDVVTDCTFSPDGRWIVSSSRDKTLRVWNVETGEVRHILQSQDRFGAPWITTCAFSPDGEWILIRRHGQCPQTLGDQHRKRASYLERSQQPYNGLLSQPKRSLDRLCFWKLDE